jgi:hypothetical protein
MIPNKSLLALLLFSIVGSIVLTTIPLQLSYCTYQAWLRNEIDEGIISQKYSSLPTSGSLPSAATNIDR